MRRWLRNVRGGLLHPRAARLMVSCGKTHGLHMVSTVSRNTETEDEEIRDNESFPHQDDDDESVTEISEEMMRSLPKAPPKLRSAGSLLSTEEQEQLTRMIFKAHYAGEGMGENDRAMWYQSALEIHWLEEWAYEEFDGQTQRDVARRAVKKAVLQRVDLHKPLAYIIGHQPFYGCDIRCSPPLLCPRPETEMWTHWLVRTWLSKIPETTQPLRVLDMCCGTGCVGIAIAKHVPSAQVTAVDILDEAIGASEENAKLNGLEASRFCTLKSDMFESFLVSNSGSLTGEDTKLDLKKKEPAAEHAGSFDIIVSNPPYVLPDQYTDLPPGIKLWESKLALVGDEKREQQQYLYFQELSEFGSLLLKPKAMRNPALCAAPNIVIEVGLQAEQVASVMEKSKLWENVEIHLDYAQQMRWITASSSH
ncbi:Mitochondrial N(5)-glutamine methyltransferase MTQ1, putative [Trypanosoma equiperdum]|uniref:peptide chain release factor N(5)-glutamine methyltransferase n=2 Tax=Trypanozoon TaxID=39700 RepID=Q389Z0_TRYB2|nr:hypothetical protein, conserved [Trypanosoma brucei brucei TREU927]EAN78380.1 hypothetical protein, conserved [Trypanosoma brucei brucei TREU927]SCU67140.1 Mitochondrial N(5)-glutamine methyltransferase MTQ1, putative [Trypanosoma equiperdum]